MQRKCQITTIDQVTCNLNALIEYKDPPPNHNHPSLNYFLLSPVPSRNKHHVQHLCCQHLEFKLSIHVRRRSESVQEEDKERSPFPPTITQNPSLQLSRSRPYKERSGWHSSSSEIRSCTGIPTRRSDLHRDKRSSFGEYLLNSIASTSLTPYSQRQPKAFLPAKMHSPTYLSASTIFSTP